ncbi:MAG: biotin/lipoyl-binding protein [Chloracidobacterium sp.]|nr:biotin/lipoyl-binding protein [Chloracidobacterium sp.]
MRLQASVGEECQEIEITRDGRDCRTVVDGREYLLDVSQPEPGVYLIKNGNTVHEASVTAEDGGTFNVRLRGHEHAVTIVDPKRLRGGGTGAADTSGKVEIRTAMPGKVVRLHVSVGDTVEKGDAVMVVEAMKMQNEMKAAKSGTIVDIRVAEDDTVGAGDVLVVIE